MNAFTQIDADEIVLAEHLLSTSDGASDTEEFESSDEMLVVAQSALLYSVDGDVDLEHYGIDPSDATPIAGAGGPGELNLLAIATPVDIDSSTIPVGLDIAHLHAEELMFA